MQSSTNNLDYTVSEELEIEEAELINQAAISEAEGLIDIPPIFWTDDRTKICCAIIEGSGYVKTDVIRYVHDLIDNDKADEHGEIEMPFNLNLLEVAHDIFGKHTRAFKISGAHENVRELCALLAAHIKSLEDEIFNPMADVDDRDD